MAATAARVDDEQESAHPPYERPASTQICLMEDLGGR
jgi:hypothetical protein